MNLCACGCGGKTKSRFVRGHHTRMPDAKPPRPAQPADKRIRDNSEVTKDGHWLWKRHLDKDGYGSIKVNKKTLRAARVSYEVFIGEVPAGLFVHQSCGRRDCVAPEHLEAVTVAESVARGASDPLQNFAAYYEARRAATHCANGHPWNEENTRYDGVQRFCRACLRERMRERRQDPEFRSKARERARELYGENRDEIRARKREWEAANVEHVRARRSASNRAAYLAAKAAGMCIRRGCGELAQSGSVMCAEHLRLQNERNWVKSNESLWDSYFERGLTGEECWLCGGEITAADPLNHDHLYARSLGGPNEVWNFAPAHRSCNVRRHNLPLDATLRAFPNYLREALAAVPDKFARSARGRRRPK